LHARDLTVPWVLSPNQNYNVKEELYRWYFDWKPTSMLAVNTQFKFENYRTDGSSGYFPTLLETAYVPTEIRFFAPNGLFSTLKGTYVNQKAQSANSPLYINSAYIPLNVQQGDPFAYHDSFFLLDAAIGYRFPKQYGLISLEVKNILNKHFIYQDRQYQMNEYHMPDFLPTRMLFARFTFNY
jgi:outer membrane receptor protein involved in Fe transport